MSFLPTPEAPVSSLPPGTQVGNWRVVQRHGQGAYGVVYRAQRIGQEATGLVALKLALYPWDRRFAREVELLSRICHPCVPRLLGHGLWRAGNGAEHPFLVMEWVDGTPLYEWARQHNPSPLQLRALLLHMARALEATHAAHAVHRDLKGDNILVRHEEARAVLIDFGAGHYQGAERLTWQDLHPGTPTYRSPAANLFLLNSVRAHSAHFEATPADDLFALGITAYRLFTGAYPPEMQPVREGGTWRLEIPDPCPLLEATPRVEPRIRELILRLLSVSPEARGTAAELADALEALDAEPSHREERRRIYRNRAGRMPWIQGAVTAGLACLLAWGWEAVHLLVEHVASSDGTTAVGDSAPTLAPGDAPKPKSTAQAPPIKPRPGQTRPNAEGQCPGQEQVPLNGACWVEYRAKNAAACTESGHAYINGQCLAPAFPPPDQPQPTSQPSDSR